MNMQWWGSDTPRGAVFADEEFVRELAQVRRRLKDADNSDPTIVDAREQLERVLDELDPAWRTLA